MAKTKLVTAVSPRVRYADFQTSWFLDRCAELRQQPSVPHRKYWENAFIVQTFVERIAPRRTRVPQCLGFGVGTDPIAECLALKGADVLATDGPPDPDWTTTNQHVSNLVRSPELPNLVYREVDMRDVPTDLDGRYDFVWSNGSLEHIGGLYAGLQFIYRAMECLRPGGWAVHTTELNVTPSLEVPQPTLNAHNLCLYREAHLREAFTALGKLGCAMMPLDTTPGLHEADLYVDPFPYNGHPLHRYHLSLRVNEWTSTSIALVIQKGK